MSRGSKGYGSIFRIEIEGMDEMFKQLDALGVAGVVVARDVLTEKAQEIKRRAQPLIPDDPESPGLLKDTIRVYAPRTKSLKPGSTVYCGVVVGGSRLKKVMGKRSYISWPLIQHEDLTLKHKHGQAKFLERPGNDVAPSIPAAIVDALDDASEGLGAS